MPYFINNRIPSLDGLRTISVFLVVASHYLYTIGQSDSYNLGILGVRVFFVISGFLITGLLLKEIDKTSTISMSKFYFRRTLRIFPPYYFYLFLIFVAAQAGLFPIEKESFYAPVTYTSNYIDADHWNLLHTWSLSVEEQFYLIFPFILLLLGRKKLAWVLIPLLIICPILRIADYQTFHESGNMWIYYGFHANADGLATGCLLSIFYAKLHATRFYRKILESPLFIVFPVALLLINSQTDSRQFYLGVAFTVSNILIALCIDWAITNYDSLLGKFLNSAPMSQIGVMSYSIYLWQQPFLTLSNPQWFNAFPYNFIGITIFSVFSYYIVEKSSLACRNAIEKTFFQKPL